MSGDSDESPLSMYETMSKLRATALDIGIVESDFWEMTIGEVNRRVESFNRMYMAKQKQKATIDYSTAVFLGGLIANVIGGEGKITPIEEVYPALFEEERKELAQARQNEINVANFLDFAAKHNLNYKQGGEEN